MLLNEAVSINSINNAIDSHRRVIINYHTKGENIATGVRIIEVYAYGLTKAGNPVIRAFQPYGDTTSRVPSWKFFRLDRISFWKMTKQKFSRPADEFYKTIGKFNPNGDNSMSVVYKIANFYNNTPTAPVSSPKLKSQETNDNDIYKTDTERGMERLRQQLDNPIKISDIKTKEGFRQFNQKQTPTYGPKLKADKNNDIKSQETNDNDIYKTDTERGMERLRQQLDNPIKIDLDKIPKR